jgi:hypothetical protein
MSQTDALCVCSLSVGELKDQAPANKVVNAAPTDREWHLHGANLNGAPLNTSLLD